MNNTSRINEILKKREEYVKFKVKEFYEAIPTPLQKDLLSVLRSINLSFLYDGYYGENCLYRLAIIDDRNNNHILFRVDYDGRLNRYTNPSSNLLDLFFHSQEMFSIKRQDLYKIIFSIKLLIRQVSFGFEELEKYIYQYALKMQISSVEFYPGNEVMFNCIKFPSINSVVEYIFDKEMFNLFKVNTFYGYYNKDNKFIEKICRYLNLDGEVINVTEVCPFMKNTNDNFAGEMVEFVDNFPNPNFRPCI